jgi:hypothetical protein
VPAHAADAKNLSGRSHPPIRSHPPPCVLDCSCRPTTHARTGGETLAARAHGSQPGGWGCVRFGSVWTLRPPPVTVPLPTFPFCCERLSRIRCRCVAVARRQERSCYCYGEESEAKPHHKSRVVFFFSPFLVQVTVAPPDPPVPLFYN